LRISGYHTILASSTRSALDWRDPPDVKEHATMTKWASTDFGFVGWTAGFLAVALSAGSSLAQQAAPKPAAARDISFAPRWTQGESRAYEEIKVRRTIPKGGMTSQVASRARIDVKVVEAGPNGYLLSWIISGSIVDGPRSAEQDADLAGFRKSMEGWNVLLDLDEAGNLRGVKNWKEIRSKAESFHESILRSRDVQRLQPEVQSRFRAQLQASVATREQIEAICTREARAFLAPIGLNFKSGQPIQYEAQIPNPKGGAAFPARARFQVTTIDPASGRAIVEWNQVVDPQASRPGLGESISRLGRRFGRPPRPGSSEPDKSLSITDECRYLMDMRSGWVSDMKQLRLIRDQDGSSFEESLRIHRLDLTARKSPGAAARPTPR
jgi:hypothetical protein